MQPSVDWYDPTDAQTSWPEAEAWNKVTFYHQKLADCHMYNEIYTGTYCAA